MAMYGGFNSKPLTLDKITNIVELNWLMALIALIMIIFC